MERERKKGGDEEESALVLSDKTRGGKVIFQLFSYFQVFVKLSGRG